VKRSASLTSPRCQRAIPRPRYPLLSGRIAAKPAELLFGFRQAPLSEVEFPQNSAGLHVKRRQGNGAPHLDLGPLDITHFTVSGAQIDMRLGIVRVEGERAQAVSPPPPHSFAG
jgi:hypothetical protein